MSEFAGDLSDQDDRPPAKGNSTTDAEASSAVESVAENAANENLPILSKETLPPEWQGEHPVLCVAGRSLIDEAAAIMLAQLSTAHGLAARVEGAEALSTTNVFRLDTTGVAIVCLVYLDASGPAHMRYAVRRLRRKLPRQQSSWAVGSRERTRLRWNCCGKARKPTWLPPAWVTRSSCASRRQG